MKLSSIQDGPVDQRAATQVLDAGWRAAAYCLHPSVIGWSLLPLLLAAGISFGTFYFLWEPMTLAVRHHMESWMLVEALLKWLDSVGASGLRSALGPLVVVAVSLPLIMALSLMLVALLMTPALTRLVTTRRFPALERRQGGSFWGGLLWSLGSTAIALLALLLSMPFWLVPPVVLVVPPLIWGWLTYRVFAYDVLADHASVDERRTLLREHRWPLLAIGVITGYLGAAPTVLFAFGLMSVVLFPLLIPIAVWMYMLVFAFAALWFAHYALGALQAMRQRSSPVPPPAAPDLPTAAQAPPPLPPPL
jgi:hypothetical protein